jgi:lysyl-tRNA synthetase class 2
MSEEVPGPAEDVLAARRQKLERLRDRGAEPYALRFERDATAAEVQEKFGSLAPEDSSGQVVRVAGRLMALRRMGKVTFGVLRDVSGDLQLFLSEETLQGYEALEDLDLGDWVGAEGEVVRTKRGELSVRASRVTLLSKSLRPMPEKWHGLKDVELRFRRRYLDLATNPEVRERLAARARILAALRQHLDSRGFVEVETPMLQPVPGGGLATPFVTHHDALGIPMYLRIAPELYLKRLLVAGVERVFEIGRNFRNEGIAAAYNPEFTMLEAYQAMASYEDMMDLVEELVKVAAEAALGSTAFEFRGERIDLEQPWRRATLLELVSESLGTSVTLDTPADFPREISPLARTHRDDPRLAEHFDLVMGGVEIAPAYSELTDPDEQRRRFEMQRERAAAGDREAHPYDEEFLVALEHGMPPAGGLRLGVDRLLMVLTDAPSLREVILFPALRPEE